MTFTLYMVRHGQTILNSYNRLQGWCDSPLTEKGTNDAHSAGKHLKNIHFDAAYSSDTKMPKRKTLTYFREQSFGYFEGNDATQTWLMVGAVHGCRTYNDLLDKYSLAATRDLLHEVDPFKDAERDEDYWARIDEGFDWLRKHHHDGENILLVSHSITIRSIVDRYAPELRSAKNGPRNGSVTKLSVSDDDVKVEYYNHHLDNETY